MKQHKIIQPLALLAGAAVLIGTQVPASAQTLLDQWNFNETSGTTAYNSVAGGANATLMGNAAFNGSGQVTLDGTSGTYVNLGSGLLNGQTSVTFEGWVNENGANNTQLYSFDNGDGVGSGGTYLRFNLGDTGNGNGGNDYAESYVGWYSSVWDGTKLLGTPLAANTLNYIAVTYDPSANYEAIYVNGSLSVSFSGSLPALSTFAALNGTLGKSPWSGYGDPFLTGTIDQFNIYGGELSPSQIAADFAAGPVAAPEPSALALCSGGLVVLGLLRRRFSR